MPYTYIDAAIESAQKYFNYLAENGKGVITVNVTRLDKEKNYFNLTLAGRPKTLDTMSVKVLNKEFSQDQIKFISFDANKRILKVLPRDDARTFMEKASAKEICLISDLKFLVKRVEKWYEKYGVALRMPADAPHMKYPKIDSLIDEPSEDQYAAIMGVLNSPFSYVWGAPGTGKTRFVLARCVLSYIQAGKKILITAPTNNAVEQTLRGVLTVLEEAHIQCRGTVIRLGVPSNEFAEQYPYICENTAAAKRLSEIADAISEIENEIKIIEQAESRIDECKELHKSRDNLKEAKEYCYSVIEEINKNKVKKIELNTKLNLSKGYATVSKSKGDELIKQIRQIAEKIGAEQKRVELYSKGFRKVLWPNKYKDCLERLKLLTETADKLRAEEEDNKNKLDAFNSDIIKINAEIENIESQQKNYTSDIIKKLKKWSTVKKAAMTATESSAGLFAEIKKIEDEYEEKSAYYEYITEEYISSTEQAKAEKTAAMDALKAEKQRTEQSSSAVNAANCNVIAATIDNCLNRILPDGDYKFEHVFLDEAGYCSLIKGATLTAYNCPVTFLGDHRQLPPVCEMNDEQMEQKDNLPVSLWAQSALHTEHVFMNRPEELFSVYLHKGDPSFHYLKKFDLLHTFRFGKALANVLAEDVYTADFCGSDTHDTDIYFIDAPRPLNAVRRTNPTECSAIVDYVRMHPDEEIGIITPYKKQIKMIKDELRRFRCDDENVMTVHGSQGREWDTVLFSVTDTTDKWFTDSLKEDSNGRNVVNTAVSRAKKKLIIVCEYEHWITQRRQLIGKLLSVSRRA